MAEADRLKIAVVGSGPAGFYAADALLRGASGCAVDLFERLPVPFGLVRYGVAPDHQGIKRVQVAFERTAALPGFRFFGNVEVGRDVSVPELLDGYHAVLFATGAALDRRLDIPGEDLEGSYAATSLVGWYNAHPDFIDLKFDLNAERAVVIGMGNVALDVARVLLHDRDELGKTDISDRALAALRASPVREVVLLGRRGPGQAAFDQGELEAIADLPGVGVEIDGDVSFEEAPDLPQTAKKNLVYLSQLASLKAAAKDRKARVLKLRFLASPVELLGAAGHVRALRIEDNRLVGAGPHIRAEPTGKVWELPTGLVIRSVGYRGMAIPGMPFDAKRNVIPSSAGRVTNLAGEPQPGLYTAGWIKRGPSGLIGTNKADAKETVDLLLRDAEALSLRKLTTDVPALLAGRGVCAVSFADYRKIDALEKARGEARGKVRDKLTRVSEMLAAAFPKA
ncbi:MAG TPA: FAD-dependent oxidoreductase [Polyangiaceae bacterium]|nr:FAD-dependent oxidoreductase [Polyangiaceae bacterium]